MKFRMNVLLCGLFAVLTAVLAAGCAQMGGGRQTPPPASPSPTPPSLILDVPTERATLKTTTVPPQETDPAIDTLPEPHLVAIDPLVTSRKQLFLFLGGQNYAPATNLNFIVRQAAANGFHAIGLSYPRTVNVTARCQSDPDEGCFGKVRSEIIDGTDRAPQVTITRANSIENRLVKLLSYLGSRFPDEGWSAYLTDGMPKWSMIRLGGHSEGGTHVALMANQHEVVRLCLLEAPVDLIRAAGGQRRLPPWIEAARTTPVDRYYGFRHLRSDSPSAEARPQAWTTFGLDRLGQPVNTDDSKPPYSSTHHLTTNAEPIADGGPTLIHRSIVVDGATPKTPTGQPLFAPIWQYACFS